MRELLIALVASALGVKVEDERARLRALLIMGQLSMVQVGANLTLNTLGWPDFAGDRAELVKQTFRDHIGRVLATPLAAEPKPPARGKR